MKLDELKASMDYRSSLLLNYWQSIVATRRNGRNLMPYLHNLNAEVVGAGWKW